MTWTRCNPEDPGTYPERRSFVLFLYEDPDGIPQAEPRIRGFWTGKNWHSDSGHKFPPKCVTHWQPLPPLPGEETEPKVATKPCPECATEAHKKTWRRADCGTCRGSGVVPLAEEQPKDDELARLLKLAVAAMEQWREAALFDGHLRPAVVKAARDKQADFDRAAARRALPDKRAEEAEALLLGVVANGYQLRALGGIYGGSVELVEKIEDWKKRYDARSKTK